MHESSGPFASRGEMRPEAPFESHLGRVIRRLAGFTGLLDVHAGGTQTTFYLRDGVVGFVDGSAIGDALGEFVFRVAVPVLLFRTIAEATFAGDAPWRIWVAYFSGVAVTWAVAHFVATLAFRRDRRVGVLAGVSSAFANTIFIGLPLVYRIDERDGESWPLHRVALEAVATCMLVLVGLEVWAKLVGPL